MLHLRVLVLLIYGARFATSATIPEFLFQLGLPGALQITNVEVIVEHY